MSDHINFVKGNLSGDGQPASLNPTVPGIEVNATWKASGSGTKGRIAAFKKKAGQDLDLIAVASQGVGPKRLCWFDDEDPFDNAALLSHGDDRKGRGGETIAATFPSFPANIDRVTFMLVAYKKGVTFASVASVLTTVSDTAGKELGTFMPDIDSQHNVLLLGQTLKGGDSTWTFHEANAMTTISRSDGLNPFDSAAEFRAGLLRVARQWAAQGN